MKAPIPPNEAARLKALHDYGVLDTDEEGAYDDITHLASFICEAPTALISLVDSERQWFKSRVGLQAKQTPREHAFCAHAILRPTDVMVVRDATADPRFADNPLVTGSPNIRFYAGAPLLTPAGDALGTVCVIDRVSRDLAPNKIEALRALARQVVTQMELRRALANLDRRNTEQRAYQKRLEDHQREIESLNTRLEARSMTDALTGVRNRRAFDHKLHEALAHACRNKAPLSLLLVDIDGFKSYNDEYGHVAGDEALQLVARALDANARPYDFVARYGGEEFAVLLPGTNAANAVVVGQRLRQAVEAIPWPRRAITASIGAATTDSDPDRVALIVRADKALYHTKQHGKNQVSHANQCL